MVNWKLWVVLVASLIITACAPALVKSDSGKEYNLETSAFFYVDYPKGKCVLKEFEDVFSGEKKKVLGWVFADGRPCFPDSEDGLLSKTQVTTVTQTTTIPTNVITKADAVVQPSVNPISVSGPAAVPPSTTSDPTLGWVIGALLFIIAIILVTSPLWFNYFFRPNGIRAEGQVGPFRNKLELPDMSKFTANMEKIPDSMVQPHDLTLAGWRPQSQKRGYALGEKATVIKVIILAIILLLLFHTIGFGISIPTATPIP